MITIVVAVILTIVLRMFIVQVFSIPSGSMEPTLQVGDRVAVNRLSYRLGPINRGDVVVFTNPDIGQPGEDDHVVKRVIGVAGDEIVLEDGAVVRNGEALSEPYAQGASHPTSPDAECTRVQPCRVPEGKVWVMGDNREMSLDSRGFGPIDTDAVVGQGTWLVWPPGRVGAVAGG